MSGLTITLDVLQYCIALISVLVIGSALFTMLTGPRLVVKLIVKYLLKRRIAWISLIAVTLCTAMVIVIISVMGGWLQMFRQSFHGLSGDVVVRANTLAGFPYYDEMSARIRKVPDVLDCVPVIHAEALLDIANLKQTPVQVFGYPTDPQTGVMTIGRVNDFPRSLYHQYQQYIDAARSAPTSAERDALLKKADDAKAHANFNLYPDVDYAEVFHELNPKAPKKLQEHAASQPAMICGCGILEIHKDQIGKMVGREDWKYRLPAELTMLSIPSRGTITEKSKVDRTYWIIDDSRTGVWQYDERAVYVPFNVVQSDLSMDAEQGTDAAGNTITIPARTSEIDVKIRPGADLNLAKTNIDEAVRVFMDEKSRALEAAGEPDPDWANLVVETWEDSQRLYLGAIEKEEVLVTGLFGLVSIVAVFLIFCIFFMIVLEKARDIGIIKSVGATNSAVTGIFLGYGLTIGLIGAGVGLFFGWLVVHYINQIHAWLGTQMGIVIWDPQVYVFDSIPNTLDPYPVAKIVALFIAASVLGALIPAMIAANMQPVESLRWE